MCRCTHRPHSRAFVAMKDGRPPMGSGFFYLFVFKLKYKSPPLKW